MLAISLGNQYSGLRTGSYVLEVRSDAALVWGGIGDPNLVTKIPKQAIMGVFPGVSKIGFRRIGKLNIRVRTQAGHQDIPIYPVGVGWGSLFIVPQTAQLDRATRIIQKLALEERKPA
jgi:hypothetical protein